MANRYNQTVPALRPTKALSLTFARLTLPFAALLTIPLAFAAAQEPATQSLSASQQSAPPDATQPPAPVVRAAPRPKSIVLPAPGASSAEVTTGAAAPRTGAATQEGGTPAVKRPVPAASSGTSGTSPSSSASPTHTAPSSFTSKVLTTPYKPNPSGALIQLPPGPFNRQVVFLDASHGGNDSGSRIEDAILEKDVTLQLAFKLRSLLAARGFTVVLSRETDAATLPDKPDTPLTLDARAGIGNHARPVACLLLHATGSGRGVHLYSSELAPGQGELLAGPWLTAQAPWVTQSIKLEKALGQAISRSDVPLVMGRASIRPVDSLTCPALVIELAPKGGSTHSLTDDGYQQQVANAIATALIFWQNTAQPPPRLTPAPSTAPVPSLQSAPMPGADRPPSLPAASTGGQP